MVARTRLSVTLYVHCLSCYKPKIYLLRRTNWIFKYSSR